MNENQKNSSDHLNAEYVEGFVLNSNENRAPICNTARHSRRLKAGIFCMKTTARLDNHANTTVEPQAEK